MIRIFFIVIIFLISTLKIKSQSLNVQIIDSITKQPIAFTNIYFSNNNGLISDDKGNFELIKYQLSQNDSMYVSMIGYNKKSFAVSFTFNDSKKTLTDKIIDKIMTRFADAYKLELGAIIRDK